MPGIVIVGAGFGGIGMGIALKKAGYHDFVILDKAHDLGAAAFGGRSFHSARWDHSCDLAGQRVAVIGTGASAIQFVPRIAEQAAQLTVFQPTPWSEGGCDSWYLDADGVNRTLWPGFTFEYWARTRRARRADYEVTGS